MVDLNSVVSDLVFQALAAALLQETAGWLGGAACAVAVWLILRRHAQRRRVRI